MITDIPDEEIILITYQSQLGDVCIGSDINVTPCEPSHGNGTTIHSLDYTPLCNDVASTALFSYQPLRYYMS